MTTLLTIPDVKALHVAAPGSAPLPLSTGELTLTLIPSDPPTRPSETVTLSVGSSSFPLLPSTPLQRVKAKEEHASYLFTPAAADGAAGVGQVLIQMRDSKSQTEWDETEAACRKLEETLKNRHLWDERIHFVNDEYDTAGAPIKGWGETVAGAVTGGASFLATKIASITESATGSTPPKRNIVPSDSTANTAASARDSTATLAERAHSTGAAIGARIHDAGKDLHAQLPESIKKLSEPTPQEQKWEIRKIADEGWEQATIAAKGIAGAVGIVGQSISENTHKAVEHSFGKETDKVAQGQSGANLGSAVASVGTAARTAVQGPDATTRLEEATGRSAV